MSIKQKILTRVAQTLSPVMEIFGYEPRYEYRDPDPELHQKINEATSELRDYTKDKRSDVPLQESGALSEEEHTAILDLLYGNNNNNNNNKEE